MIFLSYFVLLPLSFGLAAAGHILKLKEHHSAPGSWTKLEKAAPDHQIDLHIALKQSNFAELERQLYQVSNPNHGRYGQHLKDEEVNNLIRPTDDTSDRVHQWLESHSLNLTHPAAYSSAGDWICITLPVSTIERMLDADYHVYRHRHNGVELVRSPSWSLPDWLHDHISTIQPTNSFFRTVSDSTNYRIVNSAGDTMEGGGWGHDPNQWPGSRSPPLGGTIPKVSTVCNVSAMTPTCLRTLYGTIDYTVQAPTRNRIALTNFLGQVSNRSDVSLFLNRYRPDAAPAAYKFRTTAINGGSDQQAPLSTSQQLSGTGLEGNLDAETIIGLTYPMDVSTYNTGGMPPFKPTIATPSNTNEPYMDWLNYVLALPDGQIPQVISTSYGDDEQTVPPSYAAAVCQQMAQLGARGVSLLFASGDNGVGGNGACLSNDGRNASAFVPSFPASCPYVTTVGATYRFEPEVAASDDRTGFSSGGGFSNYFARPQYQAGAVDGYLKGIGGLHAGLFNTSGRAYPDIAAQGVQFATVWNGSLALLDGTSAATPTAASIVALLNDALVAAGKPALGFLNPWLYGCGRGALTDVTGGSSQGCGVIGGFPAAKGWDPVTGLGTPYFPELLREVLKEDEHRNGDRGGSRRRSGGHGGSGRKGKKGMKN